MAALPQNISAFAVYQRSKEKDQKLAEREAEQEKVFHIHCTHPFDTLVCIYILLVTSAYRMEVIGSA